jgi:hypothetical protein
MFFVGAAGFAALHLTHWRESVRAITSQAIIIVLFICCDAPNNECKCYSLLHDGKAGESFNVVGNNFFTFSFWR